LNIISFKIQIVSLDICTIIKIQATALSRLAASSERKEQSDVLFDLAARRFHESLSVKPNDYRSLHNLAYSLYLQAMNKVHKQCLTPI
jgi:hypothetical protein